jgi:hypothetical protein
MEKNMAETAKIKMSKEEERWKTEEDARTLQNAEVIKQDPERLKKAMEAAKRLSVEKRKEADAIEKVANSKTLLTK